MAPIAADKPRVAWWLPPAVAAAACAALVGVAGWALMRHARGLPFGGPEAANRLAVALAAVEAVLLAVVVPWLACRPAPSRIARILGVTGPSMALAAATLGACARLPSHPQGWGALACCQVFLLCFAAALAAVCRLAAAAGARPPTAQLIAMAIALAMLGNVFHANAAIEATGSAGAKTAAIQGVLWTNPWLIAGGSILDGDPIRLKTLYSFSVISYYPFAYPGAGGSLFARTARVGGVYLAAALVLGGLGWLLARLRRSRTARDPRP